MAGDQLDLTSGTTARCSAVPTQSGPRPFLGVHFSCCDVYARIFRNRRATAYIGHCPRCAKRISFTVGPGGTDARFFRVG